jgi:hypothetical protein
VAICIKRFDGSDGRVSCIVRTEPFVLGDVTDRLTRENAIEGEDYLPLNNVRIEFDSGESEKVITINLVDEKVPKIDKNKEIPKYAVNEDDDEVEEEEEEVDLKFKVIIERPEPEHVKISKKNCCIISIK